ncbi:MAG: 2,3,4,5-tetrahydropyridine-2,6-dicarboxylate N-succinyltransferase [Armatimonadetes bacterium]|nr:2,3,4,5-tetrahydropyridine-2,6-dicarboxylate N-succinyltransferase [Armatimonadota bacterium]
MTVEEVKAFYARPADEVLADPHRADVHERFLHLLEAGEVRSALPGKEGWEAQTWVKEAILLGFRGTEMMPYVGGFVDKTAYPPRTFGLQEGIRVVPGGSAVRRGAYVAKSVVIMPPAYINVGAYVDEGTMVDSHALVGSCAQIGKRVHLSAAAQIGGVLEPAGAVPVVVEDEAFVGGLCGVFEGVRVGARAVLASGVVLTRSTVIYDLVKEAEWRGLVPDGAVVVPGSRSVDSEYARSKGLTVSTPVIIKYRDSKTDASTALESALR